MLPAQEKLYQSYITKYDTQFCGARNAKKENVCSARNAKKENGFYDLVSLYMDLRKIANHPLLVRTLAWLDEPQDRTTTTQRSTRSRRICATPTRQVGLSHGG